MALQVVGGAAAKTGISRLTTEYLYFGILSNNNFDGATVEVAFKVAGSGKPQSADWTQAEIVPTPGNASQNSIRVFVGPDGGGVDLTPSGDSEANYEIYARISRGAERIVRPLGTLRVR
jgi:hypothetical protein